MLEKYIGKSVGTLCVVGYWRCHSDSWVCGPYIDSWVHTSCYGGGTPLDSCVLLIRRLIGGDWKLLIVMATTFWVVIVMTLIRMIIIVHCSHSNQEGLSAARKLCESLIETVSPINMCCVMNASCIWLYCVCMVVLCVYVCMCYVCVCVYVLCVCF